MITGAKQVDHTLTKKSGQCVQNPQYDPDRNISP
jgi:hypothetical protein